MSVLRSRPNHAPLKYRCLFKTSNHIRQADLSGQEESHTGEHTIWKTTIFLTRQGNNTTHIMLNINIIDVNLAFISSIDLTTALQVLMIATL